MNTKYRSVYLPYRTWKEVQEYLKASDEVIVPVGANEQHGPSCPLITDALLAQHIALEVGLQASVLVGPTIPVGDSLIHLGFAGTISLKPSTLLLVIRDYVTSLYKSGFRRFLVVDGHADNLGIVFAAFSELGEELSQLRYEVRDFWDFSSFRKIMQEAFGDRRGGHADATDASLLLAIDESLVHKELLASEYPKVEYRISRDLVSELYTTSGVIHADQRMASKETGERLLQETVKGYLDLLQHLRN